MLLILLIVNDFENLHHSNLPALKNEELHYLLDLNVLFHISKAQIFAKTSANFCKNKRIFLLKQSSDRYESYEENMILVHIF